jgi:phage-related protein|tara:strand:- start:758 stop:1150 length:393 start_codon:yes stop_codon:yes gene_type:complete
MAIGFVTSSAFGTKTIRPDKSIKRGSKPKVHLATFGDGYEQRLADGINSVNETFSVSFKTRPKADIDDIVGYLDSLKGATAFSFTIPDSNGSEASGTETTIKVVCDDFNISYDYGDFYSASAKFRRVYEA